MAFKDVEKVMYKGDIKLDFKDKAHMYFVRPRINYDLPASDPKAWGKATRPKGTTTLLGDTLEKKGLMTWPMGLALRELFGFYDFTNEKGERMTGFSKDVGTMFEPANEGITFHPDWLLPIVLSASKAWQRKQKKGADIGSVVHDAIEHYIKAQPYDIAENYNWAIKEADYDSDIMRDKALAEAPEEVEQAKVAFDKFVVWWDLTQPILHSAEEILYSKEYDICGTYDADLSIKRNDHPIFSLPTEQVGVAFSEVYGKAKKSGLVRVCADWKTSNASSSKDAAAPEGVYYSYFIQLAIYELIRREMGLEPADDLLTVSARKDGGFSLIYASELGLTVQDCIDWAICVVKCYRMADKTKRALLAHAEPKVNDAKEAF